MSSELSIPKPDRVDSNFNTALDGLNVPVQPDVNPDEPSMGRRRVLAGLASLASLVFVAALDPCPSIDCYDGRNS